MANEPPLCLQCGACCFSPSDRYVPVDGDDYERLGEVAATLTQFIGNRCYMRMNDGHCAALRLCEDGNFVCAAYASRPRICRDLARGGPACAVELAEKRPLAQAALLRRPR